MGNTQPDYLLKDNMADGEKFIPTCQTDPYLSHLWDEKSPSELMSDEGWRRDRADAHFSMVFDIHCFKTTFEIRVGVDEMHIPLIPQMLAL